MNLSPKQLFHDRSVQREVMDLKAKCSNFGCDEVLELRNMPVHLESCEYRKVLCKYGCGAELMMEECENHEKHLCLYRMVTCSVCHQPYIFNSEKEHVDDCNRHQPVECAHCKREVKKHKMEYHILRECANAPIKCVFHKVGCHQEHSRSHVLEHMESSTQIHLQYLLNAVASLQQQNQSLQEQLTSAQNHLSTTAAQAHMKPSSNVEDEEVKADAFQLDVLSSDSSGDEIGEQKTRNKRNARRRSSSSDGSTSLKLPLAAGTSRIHEAAPVDDTLTRHRTSAVDAVELLHNSRTDHEQKIISLNHHVRELSAKTENQLSQIRDINTRISELQLSIDDQALRCCNGLYYWRIAEYNRLRMAAVQGEIPVLHSPGFYTSPQGYRMCVRTNLDGVESARGTHLSLFVHVMKGDYDDLLTWPFSGSITLTIINQRDLRTSGRGSGATSHLTETLEARASLTAFQRPTFERNQKGYGYIDFSPLRTIEHDGFVRNDTLVIKAHVRVHASGVV